MKKILIAVYLLSASVLAQASGFQVNAQGQKALGMGGAFTAYNKDASAAYYNPGALALLDSGRHISLGATWLMPKTVFRSDATGLVTGTENENLFPAYLYVAMPIAGNFYGGLSINSPYAINNRWKNDWEGRAIVQEFKLNTYYFQPTLSYRINNSFSIGGGLVYAIANLENSRQIGEYNSLVNLTGDASGLGFNVGIFGKIQDELSFGITYRSGVKLDFDKGKATFVHTSADLINQFPNQNFKTNIELPSTLSVGFTNRINSKIVASFEFNLTGWSSYDSLNFDFENSETPDRRAGRRYEDAMAFRVGAEYQLAEKVTLRGGVYYDETPVRDEYISPDIPDGSRLGLTAGLSFRISDSFEIDAAYVYENVAERNAKTSNTALTIANIAGKYRSTVLGGGLGISYKF